MELFRVLDGEGGGISVFSIHFRSHNGARDECFDGAIYSPYLSVRVYVGISKLGKNISLQNGIVPRVGW